MTARRRAILIVALAALLLALIIFAVLWFWPKPDQAPNIQGPAVTTAGTTAPVAAKPADNPLNPPAAAAPAPEPGSTAAQQIAELFAERYGSYSNQGDFQNLRDLLPVMTAKYRAATEAYLSTATSDPNAPYDGVTSVKISTDVRSYDGSAGTAVIAVTLQQQKASGGTQSAPSYRSLKMTLQKVGKDWRVDSATWEN
jgi:hypothetical protein